jgi:hypothetical protein
VRYILSCQPRKGPAGVATPAPEELRPISITPGVKSFAIISA